MDEEAPAQERSKPSPAFSWATLGFLLGGLFVMTFSRREAPLAPTVSVAPSEGAKPPPKSPPQIATIEAVFAAYGKDAVWDHDVTEVAMWDTQTMGYTECFEAVRLGEDVYFRSIPHLTRPVLNHGVADNIPLRFTETAAQRERWLKESGR